MASIFMKYGDIKGEAKEDKHKEWIELESVNWSHSRQIDPGAKASQRTRGETFVNDVGIVTNMNNTSMKIMQTCANGTTTDLVEIHFCRTGSDKAASLETYMTMKLHHVLITSYSTGVAGESVPMESYTLNFTKIEMEYKVADAKGVLKTDSAYSFDKESGKAA